MTALQQRLVALGYFVGPADGLYGDLTTQAVYALQKTAGLTRDGVFGRQTSVALMRGARPQLRSTGLAIEVDLSDQLVLVVSDGGALSIVNASTGNGQPFTMNDVVQVATTPVGRFSVYRMVDGWDDSPLGELWRPAYFSGGIALHGYPDVPAYPASHGCVRVSVAAMDWMWASGSVSPGTTILVY